jgi:hypothetical protein
VAKIGEPKRSASCDAEAKGDVDNIGCKKGQVDRWSGNMLSSHIHRHSAVNFMATSDCGIEPFDLQGQEIMGRRNLDLFDTGSRSKKIYEASL